MQRKNAILCSTTLAVSGRILKAPNQLVPVFWLHHLVDHLESGTRNVRSTLQDVGLGRLDLTDSDLKMEQMKEAEFFKVVSKRSDQPI